MTVFSLTLHAKNDVKKYVTEYCTDSLTARLHRTTSVYSKIKINNIKQTGRNLDFYFDIGLSDIPWNDSTYKILKGELKTLLSAKYKNSVIRNIYANNIDIKKLITPIMGNDGRPANSQRISIDRRFDVSPLVREISATDFEKGLKGRNIAIWQSHGRYWEEKKERWQWQRPQYFTTVEDCYTQSYVLDYIIPMLENSGAYVITPRERDTNRQEIITDNDTPFKEKRNGMTRKSGEYVETGKWREIPAGFADKKQYYEKYENPFVMGTAKVTECTAGKATAMIKWLPHVPSRGKYAVYISYKSLENSTSAAHYLVRHMGGTAEFIINQQMGGSTWIYLGTFEFENDDKCGVYLDNATPASEKFAEKSVVSADAVKIGGGMGKMIRGTHGEESGTSGMPAYLEGASYRMQWSGADSAILYRYKDEYTNDFASRGPWVNYMSGGSHVNPERKGKNIPIDLSLAVHSDAGISKNDSIIGTLAIYTLKSKGKDKFPNGESRLLSRDFAEAVQSQVVNDIRKTYNCDWSRRQIRDRSYSETREPEVPSMILEILSHQNFADMKFGLDPNFRFTVGRAVYKGILKFLSNRYKTDYIVQPLPIKNFSAVLEDSGKVRLSWRQTPDSLEKTASADGYILYTRIGDGAFDTGHIMENIQNNGETFSAEIPIDKGKIYSFKIEAFNKGGKSFPSEILSAGIPKKCTGKQVLIVNNFTRVSAPAWFENQDYAGFDLKKDRGVPFLRDITFIGEIFEYDRKSKWVSNDDPGFGGSWSNEAGNIYAGNTFDNVFIHGKSIFKQGHKFCSSSSEAFCHDSLNIENIFLIDLICGKQVSSITGKAGSKIRYEVFPSLLRKKIKECTNSGKNILLSGAYIASDMKIKLYPMVKDSSSSEETIKFVKNIFGYKSATPFASKTAKVRCKKGLSPGMEKFDGEIEFYNNPNEKTFCTECPDGLLPASKNAKIFLLYSDTEIPAGICLTTDKYKAISIGFPIETIKEDKDLDTIIKTALKFFNQK